MPLAPSQNLALLRPRSKLLKVKLQLYKQAQWEMAVEVEASLKSTNSVQVQMLVKQASQRRTLAKMKKCDDRSLPAGALTNKNIF